MAKARAEIEISATSNRLAQGLSAARSRIQSWAVSTARSTANAFGDVGKSLGKIAGKGGGALAVFGGNVLTKAFDFVEDVAGDVIKTEKGLARLQISMGATAEQTRELSAAGHELSKATGVAHGEIIAGAAAYVRLTGDAAGAAGAMRTITRAAQATGTSTADIAKLVAALRGGGIAASDMEDALSGLVGQGRMGAVELNEMAAELTAILPMMRGFAGGAGAEGAGKAGAMFQVIMKNAGEAKLAATNFKAVLSSLADPATVKELGKIGINVFDKSGKARDVADIMDEIASSSKITQKNLSSIFGRQEARSAITAFQQYKTEWKELREVSRTSAGGIQRDLDTYLDTPAGRIEASMNRLKETIAAAFTPERIEAFANALERSASFASKAADRIGDVARAVVQVSTAGFLGGGDKVDNPYDVPMMEGPGRVLMEDERARRKMAAALYGRDSKYGQEETERKRFDTTFKAIGGAGSRSQQIRAALAAKSEGYDGLVPGIEGGGTGGTRAAAAEWLRVNVKNDDELNRAREQLNRERDDKIAQLAPVLTELVRAIDGLGAQKPPVVQMDANRLDRNLKSKSTNARGGG